MSGPFIPSNFIRRWVILSQVAPRTCHRSIICSLSQSGRSDTQSCNIMSLQSENYTVDIGDMRIKYKDKHEIFTEDDLISKEPIGQFKAWFEEARNTPEILEPNAMLLATATRDGVPSVRVLLLKGFGTEGFKFYTNYDSRKGRELAENPHTALTFYWEPLRRSVRIEGIAKKTSAEDSDHYFRSRPYENQIGSTASKQSSVIASRQTLIIKEKELLAKFPENQVKRPACWGGYLIVPHSVEFWQGQSDRLHDRIRFRRPKTNEKIDNTLVHEGKDGWVYERLSP
ncbi:PREDICTED: pyridoxine-5'-phosphate oxidase-like isoform X1 [Trachymyrmex cornetzi]|uniref:pyridoxine-5'-phosphate oxidase-like isoform X1 n=2 Tax=Trachymyrmex cornetzi TaxID=471704 RepID=UPI00084F8408|nr:PREDICTED: pyridoxine-5'-phosphate oxidase-like isoform X1 [Trachymyrmex cornetzi]